MQQALREARMAAEEDEVPIGAVVVTGGKVIARAHNQTERLGDATAHAEMLAFTAHVRRRGRLDAGGAHSVRRRRPQTGLQAAQRPCAAPQDRGDGRRACRRMRRPGQGVFQKEAIIIPAFSSKGRLPSIHRMGTPQRSMRRNHVICRLAKRRMSVKRSRNMSSSEHWPRR